MDGTTAVSDRFMILAFGCIVAPKKYTNMTGMKYITTNDRWPVQVLKAFILC